MKTNEILSLGADIFSTNERKSIYRKEIFSECQTDRDRKNLRMKLRKKLDSFVGEYLSSQKNKEKRDQLKKIWSEYAKQVYINVEHICDANSNTQKKESIKSFLLAMNEQPIATEKKK